MSHGTTGVPPNILHGDKFWGLTDVEQQELMQFVRGKIIASKTERVERSNGEALQVGIRVFIMADSKEKRNLEVKNWEGPFTIVG